MKKVSPSRTFYGLRQLYQLANNIVRLQTLVLLRGFRLLQSLQDLLPLNKHFPCIIFLPFLNTYSCLLLKLLCCLCKSHKPLSKHYLLLPFCAFSYALFKKSLLTNLLIFITS